MPENRPPIFQIDRIEFPKPKVYSLGQGLTTYLVEGGSQDVCKIDFMFLAGRPFEHKRLTAVTVAATIKEGTLKHNASVIAEAVDRRGATLSSPFSFDHISLQLVCLSKHVTALLPLVIDIIRQPAFEEIEIELFKKRTFRRLEVDLSHNDVVAYRKATEQYFGLDHPYGYNSDVALYQQVHRDDLIEHHRRYFNPGNAVLFIAGRVPPRMHKQLENLLSDWPDPLTEINPFLPEPSGHADHFEMDMHKPQTAIRIGRRLFNRNHHDWPAMFVLNTILGGYFGSRLMKNLRENKGLTYGIQSMLESLKYDGYFSISLETERKFVRKALKQIYQEIEILQQDLVPEFELKMVKNYLGGYLLSLMDGPIQTLDVVKNNIAEDSPYDFTSSLLQQIAHLTTEDIRTMARTYLKKENLSEVIIH
jgi:zinc protease